MSSVTATVWLILARVTYIYRHTTMYRTMPNVGHHQVRHQQNVITNNIHNNTMATKCHH